jgi:hypothetical protein
MSGQQCKYENLEVLLLSFPTSFPSLKNVPEGGVQSLNSLSSRENSLSFNLLVL